MKTLPKSFFVTAGILGLGSLQAFAQNTTTYLGNGNGSFGGPIGGSGPASMLTFTTDGTTLSGTIQLGGNNAFNDELVIYIDAKTGGFNSTATLTDTGNGGDALRAATSGLGYGGNRAALNFPTGFGADYAIALSPGKAHFGSFYSLTSTSNFTYGSGNNDGNTNLSPTFSNNGTNGNGIFTFSVPLSLLGSPRSFTFETTYLNGTDPYRSNEAFGNTIVDATNPGNNGNLAQDTGTLVGVNTFLVPEPGTWVALCLAGCFAFGKVCLTRFRRPRAA